MKIDELEALSAMTNAMRRIAAAPDEALKDPENLRAVRSLLEQNAIAFDAMISAHEHTQLILTRMLVALEKAGYQEEKVADLRSHLLDSED